MMRAIRFMPFIASAVLLMAACQTPGPVADVPDEGVARPGFPRAQYNDLASGEGRVFWVDNEASEIRFYLWRGGPMASKGHNHVMRVANMEGAVFLPEEMLGDEARIDIVFPVAGIEVDPMPLREAVGGAFASTGLTPEGAEKTREHMLDESIMNADRFPKIGLSAGKVHGELPKLVVDMALTIHGVQRRQLIPATVRVEGGTLTATGAFAIRQTDYGITPSSAMGGALYAQDPIMIEFELVGRSR